MEGAKHMAGLNSWMGSQANLFQQACIINIFHSSQLQNNCPCWCKLSFVIGVIYSTLLSHFCVWGFILRRLFLYGILLLPWCCFVYRSVLFSITGNALLAYMNNTTGVFLETGTVANTWVYPWFYGTIRIIHLLYFLCCVTIRWTTTNIQNSV